MPRLKDIVPTPAAAHADEPRHGWTPRELSRILRVSPDKILGWVRSGEMPALNVASHQCSKPQFVILPHHLATFEQGRQAAQPKPTPRRRRRTGLIDYFPGD